MEETGLQIGELKLLGVFWGKEYYYKVANGDELYSVTAVYLTIEIKGMLEIDKNESINIEFFNINHLPECLTEEYRGYLNSLYWQLSEIMALSAD